MSIKNYVSINTKERVIAEISGKSYPQIVSISTAYPPKRYAQMEVIELFGTKDPKTVRLFKQSHIKGRYLYLPEPRENGIIRNESHHELISKHLQGSIELGTKAVRQCLSRQEVDISEIDHIICVTSTGLLLPGVSAHLVKHLHFRNDIQRTDIVGMGCSGGLLSLRCASESATSGGGGKKVLLLCIEINSAAYINDGTIQTAVVNSLFGDGATALLIETQRDPSVKGAYIVGFESRILVEHMDLLRYDLFENEEKKICLILSKELPYIIGNNIEDVLYGLLNKYGLRKRDITHWVVHAGGKKVLDSIKYNLGLSDHDIRHTIMVYEEYGNLSSSSVFFSFERLMKEDVVQKGDIGVLISMGPGLSLETALLMW
jgi:alkylresorcinol/alkylpyrone synthase/polyketide synthase Type III